MHACAYAHTCACARTHTRMDARRKIDEGLEKMLVKHREGTVTLREIETLTKDIRTELGEGMQKASSLPCVRACVRA